MSRPEAEPLAAFVEAASIPLDDDHRSGTLDDAEALLAAHPGLIEESVHAAAIAGDARAVRRHLERDPALATAKGGPRGWDALTHLCFSRYLRLDPARSEGFVEAARALLDAGADPNTGWRQDEPHPYPGWESALYGAAGVARHAGLTALLLARGADPNDEEVPYHAPEGYDNAAVHALVESGRLNPDSLATMLLRKTDWHDGRGIRYLLEHGADPNRTTRWHHTGLQQSIRRDNELPIVELLLDHGADPSLANREDSRTAIQMAAWHGRGDVLAALERRGIALDLGGADLLVAACARGDGERVRELAGREPGWVEEIVAEGAGLLTRFAGVGNATGVEHLLDLGIDVAATWEGDGYWGLAPGGTALHVAAWRARHETVALLLERGAPPDARDAAGRTPLDLAVKAAVDSLWTELRAPDSVAALLAAGASPNEIELPTGYDAIDELLLAARS